MPNIYLKVAIEKNQVSSRGAQRHADIIEFLKFLSQLKNKRSGNKTVSGFSIILILKRIMTF